MYRDLIALRRAEPAFTAHDFRALSASADEDARWFRLVQGSVEILVNFSDGDVALPAGDDRPMLFATDPRVSRDAGMRPAARAVSGGTGSGGGVDALRSVHAQPGAVGQHDRTVCGDGDGVLGVRSA